MPTLRDSTVHEVLASSGAWKPFAPGIDFDLFVAAIGFEQRAGACFEQWCNNNSEGEGKKAFLIEYPFNEVDNNVQKIIFLRAAERADVDVEIVRYNQLSIYGETVSVLKLLLPGSRILVDISSMASFVFYPVLSAISDIAGKSLLSVCYTEATDYFPKKDEWMEFKEKFHKYDLVDRARLFDEYHFQSMGVDRVFESPNFVGRNLNDFPYTLVILPNFSVERVRRMINYAVDNYSASRDEFEWIIGMPPNREINGWRSDALWELFDQPSRKHDACTLDFKESLICLQKIWLSKNESRALAIATVGSKAQHLGTYMFLKMHPDVALVLSEPKEFIASKYSTGTGPQWVTSFGEVNLWLGGLRAWSQILFNW